MLQTLPDTEYLSGLAELIKTAIIGDKVLFDIIERSFHEIGLRNSELLSDLVAKSIRFKGSVVAQDEMETGLRRILNFGHTFGHAVELQNALKHGFAVASGIVLATEFSFEKRYISLEEKERIENMLKRFRLVGKLDMTEDQMEKLVLHDKKRMGVDINFVFTQGIGKAIVEKVPVNEVLGFYKRFRDKKIKL
jgi:3-dehydroquinate synthase